MSGRFKKSILLALAAGLLVGVAPIQRALNRDRKELGLTRLEPLDNAPPIIAFTTVALGGFRGLIANALWIRASELQDEDKFFEMAQLADWITKLEPHYTQVWVNQAWNMAYNISVKFKESAPGQFPDRWRWVHGGIKLLRDEGLRYNPNEVLIYRELSWFYQHKMGANLDDANVYYKLEWAHEMARVFGDQKANLDELIHPQTDDARRRAQLLTNEFKLDPVFMKQVDERYGPLEWRMTEAHAIYWAAKALEAARLNPTKVKADDLIQVRRNIFQSMQASFRHGRLVSNPLAKRFEFGPNLEIIPKVNHAYEEAIEQEAQYRDNIKGGHRNFLRDAVYYLYSANRVADAADWYAYLGKNYPNKTIIDGTTNSFPRNVTLNEYVLSHVMEDVGETDRDRVKARIEDFIFNAYRFLIAGELDLYEGWRRMARDLRTKYMAAIKGNEARIGLPPVEEIEREMLARMLDPIEGLPPEARAILRTELRLPPEQLPPATNAVPAMTNAPAPARP
jgi:hypothetical protein